MRGNNKPAVTSSKAIPSSAAFCAALDINARYKVPNSAPSADICILVAASSPPSEVVALAAKEVDTSSASVILSATSGLAPGSVFTLLSSTIFEVSECFCFTCLILLPSTKIIV